MRQRRSVAVWGAGLSVLAACGGTVDLRTGEGAGASSGTSTAGSSRAPGDTTQPLGGTTGSPMPDSDGGEARQGGAPNPPGPLEPVPLPEPEPPSCLAEPDCPWSLGGTMPMHSRGHAVVEHAGAFYLFGGESFEHDFYSVTDPLDLEPNSIVYRYDPATAEWTQRAPLPIGLYMTSAHVVNDLVYVIGGYSSLNGFERVVQIYDPATDSWDEGPPIPTERDILSSQEVGGKIYVLSGHGPVSPETPDDWEAKKELEIFDPQSGWSSGAPLPKAVPGAANCALGGRIYMFGGERNNLTSIYDVATDSWSAGTPSPVWRDGHACVRVGDSLIVLGGRNGSGIHLDIVEQYDPATDSWSFHDPLPTPRYWFAAAPLGTELYVFGGIMLPPQGSIHPFSGLLDSIEIFDLTKAL